MLGYIATLKDSESRMLFFFVADPSVSSSVRNLFAYKSRIAYIVCYKIISELCAQ